MAEIIARFADGRLLVQEERTVGAAYAASGVFVRVGHVKKVERVLSVDTDYVDDGLLTPVREARPSIDGVYVMMRRGDINIPTTLTSANRIISGFQGTLGLALVSGAAALGVMSGLTSGLAWKGEIVSGNALVSGVKVFLNVIGV